MTDKYQAAPGHNNAAGLGDLDPQCRNSADLQYPEFLEAADGTTIPAGAQFVELDFVVKYSKLSALLARFGLSLTVFSANCTVRLHTDTDGWSNFNGIASHRTGKARGPAGSRFWRLSVVIRDLEAL